MEQTRLNGTSAIAQIRLRPTGASALPPHLVHHWKTVLGPMMSSSQPAWMRNRDPILEVLQQWVPATTHLLEIGSGGGQHGLHACSHRTALRWQPSERPAQLAGLAAELSAGLTSISLAPAAALLAPIALDVGEPTHWEQAQRLGRATDQPGFDALFSANTCHIMPAALVTDLLAGAAAVLRPGGLLLLYGPFLLNGEPATASNAAFDAHLRTLDPAMGLRDAGWIEAQARSQGFALQADVAMPAHNITLIFRLASGVV